MLTALLGAAFLFVPHGSVSAAEPSDTIRVSSEETFESAESDWLSGYYYEFLDNEDEPVVKLKKCYLSGDVTVPGTAVSQGKTYRTLVTRECFSNCAGLTSLCFLETDGIKPLAEENMSEAFSRDPYLESVDITGLDLSVTQNISGMFSKNESLSEIFLSNSTLGTAYDAPLVSARRLFAESPSITALDLSGFDTTNVVNMGYIFSSMTGIRSFRFGGVFDTTNVRDLSYAFYDCPSFTGTLDLSSWNTVGKSTTKNNRTMESMFEKLPAKTIILTDFDTSMVTTMKSAFADTSFSSIDLSSFNTSLVETMAGMFDGTNVDNDYLDWITLGSGWRTSSVTSFSKMFNQRYITNTCANAVALATKTQNATSLYMMFYDTKINCDSDHRVISNAALDLSGWNVSSVTDMRKFLSSGNVSCNLTGWNYSSLNFGDDAFGGAASKANPAATANAIEATQYPASDLDDPSKFNSYFYSRAYAGLTKDGREFSLSSDGSTDSIHSLFGTSGLPIRYNVKVTMSYYNGGDTYRTATNPAGTFYTKRSTDSYSVSINMVEQPTTAEQEKWFCPYKAGLTTNGKEDRNYYEIYGYSDGRYAFKYAPTQSEWNATVKHCMYSGTIDGFKNICNEGKFLVNRVSGFKEVDISEYVGNVEIQAPTTLNGAIDMTGSSGIDYSDELESLDLFDLPFSKVSYVIGAETRNAINPVEKNGFVFIGWFDTQGNDLTDSTGGIYIPKGVSREIIIPHFKVDEKDVRIKVTFDPGENAPEGLSLSLDTESADCFSLSREDEKWTGTFSTKVALKDKTFKLPVLSIEGMDEEEPEYEFLGWECGEEDFTVSSSDTEKVFRAVFKHNKKPAQDDPAQDNPAQDDPAQDGPAQDDPSKDDPGQDDPKQDDPAQDDPAQDDPAKDDPAQDDPKQEDPVQDDPSKDDPGQDDPAQEDPKQDNSDPELSEKLKTLTDELLALREEKVQADSKNNELIDSLNARIAELENTISELSESRSKNDEVPASIERTGNNGGGSYSGYGASSYSVSGNTSSRGASAEDSRELSFETPSVSAKSFTSSDKITMSAQPEPHYAYRASDGSVKLNYDTSTGSELKEYGFFTGGSGDTLKTSSNSAASKISGRTSATSSEMKKAEGNTGTHDGGLLEAQSVGRSIFAVLILVIITGSAIFLTFRKKAVKKNRRTRK